MIFKEEIQSILRTIIGEGAIKQAGNSMRYEKGDVMKYKDGQGNWHLYKCKEPGNYSLPDINKFKKIDLRG